MGRPGPAAEEAVGAKAIGHLLVPCIAEVRGPIMPDGVEPADGVGELLPRLLIGRSLLPRRQEADRVALALAQVEI